MSATINPINTNVKTLEEVRLTLQQLALAIQSGLYTASGAAGGDLTGTYPNPTIGTNKVTNAKAAQMAANTIKGNNTAGTANAADLTVAQTKTLLAIAESDVANLVTDLAAKAIAARLINTTAPITGGGDLTADRTIAISAATATTAGAVPTPPNDTTKFLRGDATWAVPSGGTSSITPVSSNTNFTIATNNSLWECDASGGSYTLTLPAIASLTPFQVWIKKEDSSANTVTIKANAADGIDQGSLGGTIILNQQGQTIGLVSNQLAGNGANQGWSILTNNNKKMTDGQIVVGLTGDAPQVVSPSGDWTITNAGVNTIAANAVTLAKMATIAQDSIIGGATGAGTATPTALTVLPTGCMPALTGDVTNSAGSLATAIGAGKVTNTMLAGSIDLTTKVTGTLPYGNGGTGATSLTNHGVVTAGASSLATVAPSTSGNVLTSNGTDWVSSAPAGGSTVTINAQTASYTLVIGDAGKFITMSNASANTLSIPTNASVAFAIGTTITVQQIGAGKTTISATTPGTTTINSTGASSVAPTARVQWSGCTLIKTATDTWTVMGDIA